MVDLVVVEGAVVGRLSVMLYCTLMVMRYEACSHELSSCRLDLVLCCVYISD